MLESYPIAATANNWLHDSLVEIIETIHDRLANGPRLFLTVRLQEQWVSLLPNGLGPDDMISLRRSQGIRNRVFKYIRSVKPLNQQERDEVLAALASQNDIVGLLSNTSSIETIKNTFPTVNNAVKDLFLFCFDKLDDVGIRKFQYEKIHQALPSKDCGFCGFGTMMNIEEASQDQDHYLAKSIYPFASANIRNLVPMCIACNRFHKHDKDIIRDQSGTRRRAFDPYLCGPTRVSVMDSVVRPNDARIVPSWKIDFVPASAESDTWDLVFDVKERLERDIFDECYRRWIEGFQKICEIERNQGANYGALDEAGVRSVLEDHKNRLVADPGGGKDRFKHLVFELLLHLYDAGNIRVINFVRDAVVGT